MTDEYRNCPTCGVAVVVTPARRKHGKYNCNPCQVRVSVEYARRNRDKKRATNNAYHSRISDKRGPKTAAYRAKYPEKRAAHQAIQTALRNGTMKPLPCSVCGTGKAHAHHDDYAKPLDVLWLCHSHHMQRHAMLSERTKPNE